MKIVLGAALALLASSALAHGPGRYRVEEIRPPDSFMQGCLAGFRAYAVGSRINDFGVVAGNFSCYTQVDGPAGTATGNGGPFVWSPWSGATELEDGDPTRQAFVVTINNRGEAFGGTFPPNAILHGVRWPLSGGVETLFSDPTCESLDLNIAIAGNGRYSVGWGWRLAPELGTPYDFLCLQPFWLIKTPAGTEVRGPMGEPRDINVFNVAVGILGSQLSPITTAVRYHVATGQQRVLHTGDASTRPLPTDINDLGEVAGYLSLIPDATDPNQCPAARALHWSRDDVETLLPLLAGDSSSRAWSVGYNGEIYGESGAGEYCNPEPSESDTAVVWRDGRVFDLNDAIPAREGVTLVSATGTNRRGQVIGHGYRNDDPLVICPRVAFDPVSQTTVYDLTNLCHPGRLFLLTPVGR